MKHQTAESKRHQTGPSKAVSPFKSQKWKAASYRQLPNHDTKTAAEIHFETSPCQQWHGWGWKWRGWVPRLAVKPMFPKPGMIPKLQEPHVYPKHSHDTQACGVTINSQYLQVMLGKYPCQPCSANGIHTKPTGAVMRKLVVWPSVLGVSGKTVRKALISKAAVGRIPQHKYPHKTAEGQKRTKFMQKPSKTLSSNSVGCSASKAGLAILLDQGADALVLTTSRKLGAICHVGGPFQSPGPDRKAWNGYLSKQRQFHWTTEPGRIQRDGTIL